MEINLKENYLLQNKNFNAFRIYNWGLKDPLLEGACSLDN